MCRVPHSVHVQRPESVACATGTGPPVQLYSAPYSCTCTTIDIFLPLRNAFADERRGWKRSAELAVFERAFQRFVGEWVVPQFGCDCLVSPATLRVVLPGGVRPSRPHCDADYGYDASEVNFWVPLTRVAGASSMWLESAPGRADFKPIDAMPGHACRFYGSRCRHFTVENASDLVSVRFDFRVLPRHLACAELRAISRSSSPKVSARPRPARSARDVFRFHTPDTHSLDADRAAREHSSRGHPHAARAA